jgi:hypothetical protein
LSLFARTLSPHVLSVLAKRDNSAAIRKHAKDALIAQILEREGLACSQASRS